MAIATPSEYRSERAVHTQRPWAGLRGLGKSSMLAGLQKSTLQVASTAGYPAVDPYSPAGSGIIDPWRLGLSRRVCDWPAREPDHVEKPGVVARKPRRVCTKWIFGQMRANGRTVSSRAIFGFINGGLGVTAPSQAALGASHASYAPIYFSYGVYWVIKGI